MRPWSQLTPQERHAAREQYKNLRQLPPEKKDEVRQHWEQYQNLPPETATRARRQGTAACGQARRADSGTRHDAAARRAGPWPLACEPFEHAADAARRTTSFRRHSREGGDPVSLHCQDAGSPPPRGRRVKLPAADEVRPLAGIARRYAALLYEALLLVALVLHRELPADPARVAGQRLRAARSCFLRVTGRIVSFVALFALGAAFFGWSWSDGRRTLPMKTWRLALVTIDGRAAPTPHCAGALHRGVDRSRARRCRLRPRWRPADSARSRGRWLRSTGWRRSSIRERQFLHDRIAGTRLVDRLVSSAPRQRSAIARQCQRDVAFTAADARARRRSRSAPSRRARARRASRRTAPTPSAR